MNVVALTRRLDDGVGGSISHKILASLNLQLEMLMMLDPPTFRESPRYEVPIKPHIVWCRSSIWYKGLVSKSLNIFLVLAIIMRE